MRFADGPAHNACTAAPHAPVDGDRRSPFGRFPPRRLYVTVTSASGPHVPARAAAPAPPRRRPTPPRGRRPAAPAYHDQEWGRPVHGDDALYERLCLEAFQS
ncbi:DNA-3-methyladenine glycosylase I, partial [Streptomyces minutiscleroticus]|uniref:DNA-3-methyladenine glycosylase I n=1 Tax=Streptomyces minutiscleroticus TaxID=68238 RepID=UPI00332E5E0F